MFSYILFMLNPILTYWMMNDDTYKFYFKKIMVQILHELKWFKMDSIIRQQYTCSQWSNGHIVSITENVHIETKVRNSTSKAILFEIDKITNKKCGWQNLQY